MTDIWQPIAKHVNHRPSGRLYDLDCISPTQGGMNVSIAVCGQKLTLTFGTVSKLIMRSESESSDVLDLVKDYRYSFFFLNNQYLILLEDQVITVWASSMTLSEELTR